MDDSNQSIPLSTAPIENTQSKNVQVIKRSNVPIVLIIIGIVGLPIPCFILYSLPDLIFVITRSGFDPNYWSFLKIIPLVINVVLFITQIIYGFYLIREQKHRGGIHEKQRVWAIFLLTIGVLAGIIAIPIVYNSIVIPYVNGIP